METIDINAEVQSALPAVLEKMRERIADRIGTVAEQTAMEEVRKAVQEWAITTLVPEVKAQLDAGKAGMVKQAQAIAQQIGVALGQAMSAQAEKSLASGHVVKDIAEKMFRGY